MKWNLVAGLVTALFVHVHAAPPADACGVKLTVKSSAPRKAVTRTSNPSDVLLLGNPPRRLETDLSAAGHRVEVAPTASSAKRKTYAVVITDTNLADEARSSFPGAVVIVRSGDVTADMRSVEQQVGRKPVRTEEARTPVATRATRTPLAAGPTPEPERKIVNASPPRDATPEPTPPPPPERVATATRPAEPKERVATATRPAEPKEPKEPKGPKVSEVTPAPSEPRTVSSPAPKATVVKPGAVHDEVYFTLGSSSFENKAGLNKAARWLTDASDVHVIVEGHADPTGTHEGNMVLSQKRAEFVRDFLVSAGIDQSRIEVMAFGDTRLRYGKVDRRNRRAAIVVK